MLLFSIRNNPDHLNPGTLSLLSEEINSSSISFVLLRCALPADCPAQSEVLSIRLFFFACALKAPVSVFWYG